MPSGSCDSIEEVGLSAYHFDAQAFLFAAHDIDGGEFAALDTLQYSLARDAERAHCLAHRQEGLAGNNAVIEQAMDGRWGDAKHDSSRCGLPKGLLLAISQTGVCLRSPPQWL